MQVDQFYILQYFVKNLCELHSQRTYVVWSFALNWVEFERKSLINERIDIVVLKPPAFTKRKDWTKLTECKERNIENAHIDVFILIFHKNIK